ncbi:MULTISPECIES: hypothetical protein [unclassified Helicobacter]|uniref:hypothetical protein n=1 Tax=unclassified Helicobacter TaxID=2593540 RepID=UPI000CF18E0B|nr:MULTISPECIES: hypothetical protein [unclassified Helicobacter]
MKFLFYIIFSSVVLLASEDVEHSQEGFVKKNFLEDSHKRTSWIHSVGMLVSYFDDGSITQGYAVLLRNGYFLTASQVVNNQEKYPKSVYVKMQDDSAKPLICIAKLQVRAIDKQKGLALLKTVGYTDDYCEERPQSFYHKRIYDLYAINPFLYRVGTYVVEKIQYFNTVDFFYPTIKKQYSFSVGKISKAKKVTYFDENFKQDIFYAYTIEQKLDLQKELGKPFFDSKNHFVGLYTLTGYSKDPVVVSDNFIKSFLCSLQADFELSTWDKKDCKIFQDNLIDNIKSIVKKPLLNKK